MIFWDIITFFLNNDVMLSVSFKYFCMRIAGYTMQIFFILLFYCCTLLQENRIIISRCFHLPVFHRRQIFQTIFEIFSKISYLAGLRLLKVPWVAVLPSL